MWYRVRGEVQMMSVSETCEECLAMTRRWVDETVQAADEADAAERVLTGVWASSRAIEEVGWNGEPEIAEVPEEVMMARMGVRGMFD